MAKADIRINLRDVLDTSTVEERRVFRMKPARITNTPCRHCGQRLIEIKFVTRFLRACNNWECEFFRHPQGSRQIAIIRPARKRWLHKREGERQARYDFARSLGIGSREASRLRDRTRVDIEKFAKEYK